MSALLYAGVPSPEKIVMSNASVRVWDLPTRIFHWLLAASVLVAYITGGERGTAFVLHVGAGHLILLLLLFRILWGFIGSPYSRFADFVYSWRSTLTYLKDVVRLRPTHFVGHNPLGGLMVLAMFLLLLAIVGTGLSSAAARGYQAGAPLIAAMGSGSRAMGDIHETLGSLIMILAGIHVAAVFAHWLFARENLVRAMVTGRKRLARESTAVDRPFAGRARLAIMAVLVLVTAVGLFGQFDATVLSTRPTQPLSQTGEAASSDMADEQTQNPDSEIPE
ncbi:cytochrome b/b6 domain-containing protein [Hypericibacter terrae]|nr:cytochrome b/b6 domain-containing protein [Hypericibacter terrae]